MPLPRAAERAADQIARRLAGFDQAVVDYILTGGRFPSVGRLLDELRPLVFTAVSAAIRQIDPDASASAIRDAVDDQLAQIAAVLRSVERDARTKRRRIPRRLPEQGDDESTVEFAGRVGAIVAVAAIVAARRRRTRRPGDRRPGPPLERDQVLRIVRKTRTTIPRATAAHIKTLVRTDTAIQRNRHAAAVALRDGKVILVLDARRGPTDEACEDVNGQYATATWIRRHPVEHPNCTRLGRPVTLPPGKVVTLLE